VWPADRVGSKGDGRFGEAVQAAADAEDGYRVTLATGGKFRFRYEPDACGPFKRVAVRNFSLVQRDFGDPGDVYPSGGGQVR
jgi:hypothetical protein